MLNSGPALNEYDVIVIGSGVGGAITARRLAEKGVRVLIIERGDFVPRETDNWSVAQFSRQEVQGQRAWLDRNGNSFDPGMFYNVGGSTKFYGGAMFRLRERDFEEVEHKCGISPAWPIQYSDLAPYYDEAERMFRVHGDDAHDKTSPRGDASNTLSLPYLQSQSWRSMAQSFRSQGLSPSSLPLAVNAGAAGTCILCKTCDGFPCMIAQKNDAETCGVEPCALHGTGRSPEPTHLRVDC